jgi:hypothetical protein
VACQSRGHPPLVREDPLEFERAKLLVDNLPDNFVRRHFDRVVIICEERAFLWKGDAAKILPDPKKVS